MLLHLFKDEARNNIVDHVIKTKAKMAVTKPMESITDEYIEDDVRIRENKIQADINKEPFK